MIWVDTPESSNIGRIGYDGESQILAVEFKNGTTYNYYGVPENVFEMLKASSSKGQFLAQSIKGAYRYARA